MTKIRLSVVEVVLKLVERPVLLCLLPASSHSVQLAIHESEALVPVASADSHQRDLSAGYSGRYTTRSELLGAVGAVMKEVQKPVLILLLLAASLSYLFATHTSEPSDPAALVGLRQTALTADHFEKCTTGFGVVEVVVLFGETVAASALPAAGSLLSQRQSRGQSCHHWGFWQTPLWHWQPDIGYTAVSFLSLPWRLACPTLPRLRAVGKYSRSRAGLAVDRSFASPAVCRIARCRPVVGSGRQGHIGRFRLYQSKLQRHLQSCCVGGR